MMDSENRLVPTLQPSYDDMSWDLATSDRRLEASSFGDMDEQAKAFFQNSNSMFQNQMSMSHSSRMQKSSIITKNVTQTVTRKSKRILTVNGKVVEEEEVDETATKPSSQIFTSNSESFFTNKQFFDSSSVFGGQNMDSMLADFDNIGAVQGKSSLDGDIKALAIAENKVCDDKPIVSRNSSDSNKKKPSMFSKLGFGKVRKDLINDSKENAKLHLIINELLTTEENYVRDLARVVDNYMEELNRPDAPEELAENKVCLFGNIEHIYMFHDVQFKTDLQECERSSAGIGDCFLKHKKEFCLYRHYNRNKPYTEKYLSKYGHFFKDKQKEINDAHGLSSYLIKPTQRIGRYVLLLRDLSKECKKNKFPVDELNEAVQMLEYEIKFGNDLMALDALTGLPTDLDLKAYGDLIYRDKFTVVAPGKGSKYEAMVFLFKEIIVISDVQLKDNIDKHYYKDSILLKDVGLTECVSEPKIFKIWYLKHNKKNYALQTKPEIKQLWIDEIKKQLEDELNIMKEESAKKSVQNESKFIDLNERKFTDVKRK